MSCSCEFRKKIIESKLFFDPKKIIYMDYNATTPVDPRVLGAFENACRNIWGNPSSLHIAGTKAWETLDASRNTISKYFGCGKEGIKFCGSGSEAIHAGIWGVLFRNKKYNLITTVIEHSAVKNTARHLKTAGRRAIFLKVDEQGRIDIEDLERALKKNPALLVISPVNHETGGMQDVKEIYNIAKSNGSLLFLDGVQAACRLHPDEWTGHCDMFAVSGHKIYAPKGTAFLWTAPGLRLSSFRFGGNQEEGIFPGTENIPGILSLSASVELMSKEFKEEKVRIKTLTEEGLKILLNEFPEMILESPDDRAPGILSISFPWIKKIEELMYSLIKQNICVSRFSACSNRVDGPSSILTAMNRPTERTTKSMRISLGRWSKREDFFYLANAMKKLKNL